MSERESMQYDVVIVGAGPAGLAASIRLKQLAAEAGCEIAVCILEKGSEAGAHIMSGAVVDPIGIDRLLPDWREDADHPFKTPVTADHFLVLGPSGSVRLPNFLMPPLMNNHGNYVVSLGNVCRWLAGKAEALGVKELDDVYVAMHLPGAQRLVYGRDAPQVTAVIIQLPPGATVLPAAPSATPKP